MVHIQLKSLKYNLKNILMGKSDDVWKMGMEDNSIF